jgi:hypothetical protein
MQTYAKLLRGLAAAIEKEETLKFDAARLVEIWRTRDTNRMQAIAPMKVEKTPLYLGDCLDILPTLRCCDNWQEKAAVLLAGI